jgi:2-polyprenyl-6-methoxyphenol hydroxylase-like FAD-dependent oxidoreductase
LDIGIEILRTNGKPLAIFNASGDVNKQASTSEFEILRGDLARLFVDAATHRPGVRIVYGDYVSSISQSANGTGPAHVKFANGKLPTGEYDLVVGADGVWSRTRSLITGRPVDSDAHLFAGINVAYFTAQSTASDSPTHARIFHAPGGRVIAVRPSPAGTSVTFVFRHAGLTKEEVQSVDAQKALVARVYRGTGWEVPRHLASMAAADDFYFDRLAQVRLPRWSVGCVGLLGDGAYAPTPVSGYGTSLALYGAYVLAGELGLALRDGRSVPDALARYDAAARPYVERSQASKLVARLVIPQTRVGIWFLHAIVAIFDRLKVQQLMERLGFGDDGIEEEPLPEYTWTKDSS